MGLLAVYERFLQAPNPLNLAENSTLQYVTTLASFVKQGSIIRHLDEQHRNAVKKKSEKVISAVEGHASVAVVVETTLEFVTSGGAYLPGLDTFILDRVATLPVTHFVHFDQDGKITQIRLSWDQGDLLKQVEVIGTRGKNWPVYGGKDQIKMITASVNTANEVNPAPVLSPRGRPGMNDRSSSPSKKYIKDPHASLDVYREEQEERREIAPNAVAPRESAKPAPRDMSDIFAAGHEDYEATGPGGSARKSAKENYVAPKGAAYSKFQPSRLFEEEEVKHKPDRHFYKTNPARYNHFDIGDADDNDTFQHHDENEKPKDVPIRSKQGGQQRNIPQWGFHGVSTPDKVKQKSRGQEAVHFSYEDAETNGAQPAKHGGRARREEETHFEFKDNGTPVMRNTIPQPRKDQVSHFDFNDEATPGPRRIISRTAAAAHLYDDPVFGGEEYERPLQTVSHNARKDNDLASHWGVDADQVAPKQQPAGRGRKEVEKGFWDF